MKKLVIALSILALGGGISQAQAAPSISNFLDRESARDYYSCSYKGKTASKKCLVTKSQVNSSIDPRTKQFYGANYKLPSLTINWPDGDTSRYVFLDSGDLYNLADRKSYSIRNWDQDTRLARGLFIDNSDRDHVRLW